MPSVDGFNPVTDWVTQFGLSLAQYVEDGITPLS